MKQFRATQNTPQYGPQSLYMRFIGKYIFMKGVQNSTEYVNRLIDDFEKKGAKILRGKGGWLRIDIIRNNDFIKLGDIEFDPTESTNEEIEQHLFDFFFKKYKEAKFMVQEIEN